jgi:aminopeptidase
MDMLSERQLDRYADVLLWGLKTARRGNFKKKDIVAIRYDRPALGLAEVLYAKLLQMGMNPVQRMLLTAGMERHFFKLSNAKQLVFQPPGEEVFFKNLNGSIFLRAPESLTHLSDVDPKKIAKAAIAAKNFRDILERREADGDLSWTLCMYPTEELAKHAGLTLKEYTGQVINACFLNKRSPVAEWQNIFKNASAIKKWLNRMHVNRYHVESDNVDLEITPGEKRKWIGISGRNIPSFEIFLSPDWRGTKGLYFADQPSYRSGNLVQDVRLEFKKGVAFQVEARVGGDFVRKQLAMDKGANKVGEFSLTDKRFSRINRFMANTLYDENYGGKYGNCHVALGSSYSNTFDDEPSKLTQERKKKLGFNISALHWDLVNTEKKRVVAHLQNGQKVTIYENGKFTY